MSRLQSVARYALLVLVFGVLGATASFGVSRAAQPDPRAQYPVGMLHWNGQVTNGQDATNYWCDLPYQLATLYRSAGRYSAVWHTCQ